MRVRYTTVLIPIALACGGWVAPAAAQSVTPIPAIGKGCTTAYYIDEDCDGYGVAVRSSGKYSPALSGVGLGDKPDADDTSSSLNTTASVIAAYGSGGILSTGQLKTFLSARRGYTVNNVYYIATTGNNSTGAPNDPTRPYAQLRGSSPGSCFGTGPYSSLAPGDLVIYRTGTYMAPCMGDSALVSGTSGQPIIYMTYPGEAVTFVNDGSSAVSPNGRSWVVIDGFKIEPVTSGTTIGFSLANASNTTFRNIETQRFYWNASGVDGINGVVLENTVSHHSLTEHCYYFGSNLTTTTNLTIRRNVIYSCEIMGIQHNGRASNMIIEENIVHSTRNGGMSLIMGMSNSSIRNNLLFNNWANAILIGVYDGDCVYTDGPGGSTICPYDSINNLITNNTIWIGKFDYNGDGTTSAPQAMSALTVFNNLGTGPKPAYWIACPTSPYFACDLGTGNTFQNNVIYVREGYAFNFGGDNASQYSIVEGWLQRWTIRNNVVYKAGAVGDGAVAKVYGGTNATTYSFATFDAMYAGVYGNVYGDPLFVRADINDWDQPELFDFRLQSSSPARAVGASTGAPPTDITGAVRNAPHDAGAYQGGGARPPTSTPPAAPTGLRIVR